MTGRIDGGVARSESQHSSSTLYRGNFIHTRRFLDIQFNETRASKTSVEEVVIELRELCIGGRSSILFLEVMMKHGRLNKNTG